MDRFAECPFGNSIEQPIDNTAGGGDVIFEQLGDYDAFGSFADRDSYPGPE